MNLRQYAEACRGVAIDGDGEQRRGILRVRGNVGELGQLLELAGEAERPAISLVQIGILQDILELAACDPAADGDVLRGLQEQRPGDSGASLGAAVDDLRRRGVTVSRSFRR